MLRSLAVLVLLCSCGGVSSAPILDAAPDAPCTIRGTEPASLDTGTGTLSGTLELPAACGPLAVALFHAGSGPTDRAGNSVALPGRNDSLKLLAEALAERGIASLRFDKRGIGKSAAAGPASERDYHFATLVDDATRWITGLGQDARFGRVVVVGHSEGSLIGMVAAQRGGTRGFVSLEGPGRPAGQVLREQLARSVPASTAAAAEPIIAALEAGREVPGVPRSLIALFRPEVQPYLIEWFAYDPAREIGKLAVPALVVQGTTDLQVSTTDARLLAAGKPGAELVIVEGMNHVLKAAEGDVAAQTPSYSDPSLPVVPAAVDAVAGFIARLR
jgi:pimeloyl-ACP methyl ester carboxylesterase